MKLDRIDDIDILEVKSEGNITPMSI